MDRRLLVLAIVAVLAGTPIASMILLSEHIDRQEIVIEAGSYHKIFFGFYGFGKLRFSASGVAGQDVYLLELDRMNMDRFEDGEDYDYMGYQSIGWGGEGYSTMAGFQWELFIVLVNDGFGLATVEFEADSTAYFSTPIALAILGAVAVVGYWLQRSSRATKRLDSTVQPLPDAPNQRRRAALAIVAIIILSVATFLVLGRVLPGDIPFGFSSVLQRTTYSTLAGTAVALLFRFKLAEVKQDPAAVIAQLAYRLRVSGYRVSERSGTLSVNISSTSAVKIFAKASSQGTRVSYRADPTPTGWSIVILLILIQMTTPAAMAIALFMVYRSAVFANDRLLPRLSFLPVRGEPAKGIETHAILVESLSEGRRLSAEAYEAARSNYHDSIIIMVVVGLTLSMVLFAFGATYLPDDLDWRARTTYSSLIAFLAATAMSLVSWRVLARKAKPRIQELKSWTTRLEWALRREVAAEQPPDGEPSSFELVMEYYGETPKWFKLMRKSGMFRQPGDWIIIFCCASLAVSLALGGVAELLGGNLTFSLLFLGPSAGLALLATLIYMRWRKSQAEEEESTTRHIQKLKADMETYLKGV